MTLEGHVAPGAQQPVVSAAPRAVVRKRIFPVSTGSSWVGPGRE